jgi:hypothetical protein
MSTEINSFQTAYFHTKNHEKQVQNLARSEPTKSKIIKNDENVNVNLLDDYNYKAPNYRYHLNHTQVNHNKLDIRYNCNQSDLNIHNIPTVA